MSTPLYALFSLLSLDLYVRHTQEDRPWGRWYGLALAAFVLAALAKSAAVALPLSMLVVDAWLRRPLKTYWLEKAPFFIVALGFGALTLVSRTAAGHTGETRRNSLFTCRPFIDGRAHDMVLLVQNHRAVRVNMWYPFVKTAEGWHWQLLCRPCGPFGIGGSFIMTGLARRGGGVIVLAG